jgi:hypothetical protein
MMLRDHVIIARDGLGYQTDADDMNGGALADRFSGAADIKYFMARRHDD